MTQGFHPHFPQKQILNEIADFSLDWSKIIEAKDKLWNKVKDIFDHYSSFIGYLESKLLLVPNIGNIKLFTKDFLALKSLC
jgi:hypothetical protein